MISFSHNFISEIHNPDEIIKLILGLVSEDIVE